MNVGLLISVSYYLLQLIFLLIVNEFLLELNALAGFLGIFMHIKVAEACRFYNTAGNIGAVVGYTLEVSKKVGENEAVLDGALALLKS